jgi:bifunctional non-homologous end joining protein LigD
VIIDQDKVKALSRHGRDWTGPYRRVVEAAGKLSCQAAILDGEVIVQDENGITDFDALRSAIHKAPHRIVFFAFDLLHLDGQDLRRTPLLEAGSSAEADRARSFTDPVQRSCRLRRCAVFKHAAELGLEGIVSKRAKSLYRGGPSKNWLKTKNMVEVIHPPWHRDQ